MSRRTAIALAVLVLGALGWWLFRPNPDGGGSPATFSASTIHIVSHNDTQAPDPGRPAPAPGGPPGVDPPAAKDKAAEAGPPDRWIEGVCVLEDGLPLAGAEIGSMEWIRSHGRNAPDSWRSGEGGAFRIQDRPDPVDVRHPTAVLVAAEGAEILPSDGSAEGKRIRISGRTLRLTFRDKPWFAHVRLLNADTGVPVTKVKGLQVRWHVPGGWMSMGFTEEQAPGGWIPILAGRLPESGGRDQAGIAVDLSKVEVEFALPGFEKGRLPLADIKGRMEIGVRPVPPDATGEIDEPPVSGAGDDDWIPVPPWPVNAHLRWTGPEPAPATTEVQGIPDSVGKFSLYDLPDGSWEIEVAATIPPGNTVVRGRKAFERHGATVDLGKIVLVEGGKVALRVVDSADEPIPQAWAVVVRPEESADQGRRLDLDQKGAVSVGDLEPGVGYRVVVKGLPRDLEQTVVAAAAAEAKPVEFKWTEKLVPCRITLIVDGKAVANADGRTSIPAVVQDSPLPRDRGAWKSDGTFEAKLVPGTYRFSVLATPKEGGDLALFAGEVTVPSGDAFEARLELQRGAK